MEIACRVLTDAVLYCTVLYMPKSYWDWYDDYERWVDSQDLTVETKRTYLVHVRRFIRWREGSIEGGESQRQ